MTRSTILAAAASTLLVAAVYVFRLDHAAGLMVDDAWYLVLAEALARGEGFRVISSVAAVLPPVPPGFPAILSTLVRLAPTFPDNVILLKSVSIAAMGFAGAVAYFYAGRVRRLPGPIAACIAFATVLMPAFVFLATSTLMAECVFLALQLAAIVALDRAGGGDARAAGFWAAWAAALAAAAVLVRTAGIVFPAAAVLFLIGRRRWRAAAVFAVAAGVCLAPWQLYARAHQPTASQLEVNGGGFSLTYGEMMRLRIGGNAASGRATPAELVERVVANAINVPARDVGGIAAAILYRSALESGEEVAALGGRVGLRSGSMGSAGGTIAISLMLSAVMIVGFIAACRERVTAAEIVVPASLALIVTIPFLTFRYVLPLAPFLFVYLALGLRTLTGRLSDPWRAARIVLLSVIALDLVDHARYITAARDAEASQHIDWLRDARSVDEVLAWMRGSLGGPGSVASTNPALVYLATGRTGVALEYDGERWNAMKRNGVRYLVALAPMELPPASRPYRVLFRGTRPGYWVIEI